MSLETEGKLIVKNEVEVISETFKKLEFVIEKKEVVGQKEFIDYIKFELTQNNCSLIDNYSIGENIKVEFNLRGRKWTKDGKDMYFTNLQAWRLTHVGASEVAEVDTNTNDQIPLDSDDNDPLPF